jgi:hypothetical protein
MYVYMYIKLVTKERGQGSHTSSPVPFMFAASSASPDPLFSGYSTKDEVDLLSKRTNGGYEVNRYFSRAHCHHKLQAHLHRHFSCRW